MRRCSERPSRKRKFEPLYIDGKLVCPGCHSREHLRISDYGVKEKGVLYFVWRCSGCGASFKVSKPVSAL